VRPAGIDPARRQWDCNPATNSARGRCRARQSRLSRPWLVLPANRCYSPQCSTGDPVLLVCINLQQLVEHNCRLDQGDACCAATTRQMLAPHAHLPLSTLTQVPHDKVHRVFGRRRQRTRRGPRRLSRDPRAPPCRFSPRGLRDVAVEAGCRGARRRVRGRRSLRRARASRRSTGR
jgi:hypothetical protein